MGRDGNSIGIRAFDGQMDRDEHEIGFEHLMGI